MTRNLHAMNILVYASFFSLTLPFGLQVVYERISYKLHDILLHFAQPLGFAIMNYLIYVPTLTHDEVSEPQLVL